MTVFVTDFKLYIEFGNLGSTVVFANKVDLIISSLGASEKQLTGTNESSEGFKKNSKSFKVANFHFD